MSADKPMSLVDEIEALADAAYHYNADQADWDAFRGRIAALESELNDLRKPRTVSSAVLFERSSALPCSNISDPDGEDGS